MDPKFFTQFQGKDYVLYAGLLDQAHKEGLKRIRTTLLQVPGPENANTAIAQAEVETEKGVFTGIGDASPANVNKMISLHLIRMAETRSKARALRDATNIGVTAFEEIMTDEPATTAPPAEMSFGDPNKPDPFLEKAAEKMRDRLAQDSTDTYKYNLPDPKWDRDAKKAKIIQTLLSTGEPGKAALASACEGHKKDGQAKPVKDTAYLTLAELEYALQKAQA